MDVSRTSMYAKQLLLFYKFYDFFCRRQSLMNRPCYENLSQIMKHDNFWHLCRVVFTQRKHLENQVNAFWNCLKVIKVNTSQYLMKSVPIPANQNSFEILQLFDTWHYQILVILFFSSAVTLILKWIKWCCLIQRQNPASGATWLKVD